MSEKPDLTEGGKKPWRRKERREVPWAPDQEKFSTQRTVTYVLLLIFASASAVVFWQNDQSERSMVLQTIINLTLLAVGYWVGQTKSGQDQAQSMSRMAEAAPSVAAAVVRNAATTEPQPVKIVEGAGTAGGEPLNVTTEEKK